MKAEKRIFVEDHAAPARRARSMALPKINRRPSFLAPSHTPERQQAALPALRPHANPWQRELFESDPWQWSGAYAVLFVAAVLLANLFLNHWLEDSHSNNVTLILRQPEQHRAVAPSSLEQRVTTFKSTARPDTNQLAAPAADPMSDAPLSLLPAAGPQEEIPAEEPVAAEPVDSKIVTYPAQ